MTWVHKLIESTEESESPEKFWYWAALAGLSAVARKNVYLDRFYYKLYPNLYVLLMGKSGLRKGNPVSLVKNLVAATKATRVISGRNSTPAVLKELGKAYTLETGEIVTEAHAFLCTGELSSFMVKDQDGMTILTDLYDTHSHDPEWKNTLKTAGVDTLKSPCITLLAASNEVHFFETIPESDIKGGFIGRTFMAYADKKRCVNDLTEAPKRLVPFDDLARELKKISTAKGEFKWSVKSKALYRSWYAKFCESDHNDPTGTLDRVHDNVLKVSMLLSLSESLDLVIHERHMAEALERSLDCVMSTKQITMGTGKSAMAQQTAQILKYLLKYKEAPRRKILQRFWGELDAYDLDRIAETLVQAGAIIAVKRNKDVVYIAKDETIAAYTRFKSEVN